MYVQKAGSHSEACRTMKILIDKKNYPLDYSYLIALKKAGLKGG